jgi:hypothetical protein
MEDPHKSEYDIEDIPIEDLFPSITEDVVVKEPEMEEEHEEDLVLPYLEEHEEPSQFEQPPEFKVSWSDVQRVTRKLDEGEFLHIDERTEFRTEDSMYRYLKKLNLSNSDINKEIIRYMYNKFIPYLPRSFDVPPYTFFVNEYNSKIEIERSINVLLFIMSYFVVVNGSVNVERFSTVFNILKSDKRIQDVYLLRYARYWILYLFEI